MLLNINSYFGKLGKFDFFDCTFEIFWQKHCGATRCINLIEEKGILLPSK